MKVLDDITNKDVEENLEYYKNLFITEKIIGFNKFSLYNFDENNNILLTHTGEKIFSENARKLIKHITNALDHEIILTNGHQHEGQRRLAPDVSEEELLDFSMYNIHSDISEVANPNLALCMLIGMVMDTFTCSPDNGKTFFIDREKMLDDTPAHIKEWMQQIHIVGRIGEKSIPGIRSCDWDGNVWPLRSMPGIVTHPVTGINNFAFSSNNFTVVAEDMSLELEYRDFIDSYFKDLDNWITWEWSEGKCVIWDNLSMLHTYSAGWLTGQRVFSRLQAGVKTPYYKLGLND